MLRCFLCYLFISISLYFSYPSPIYILIFLYLLNTISITLSFIHLILNLHQPHPIYLPTLSLPCRVVCPYLTSDKENHKTPATKRVCGIDFIGFGSHSNYYPHTYLTAAVAIGYMLCNLYHDEHNIFIYIIFNYKSS